MFLIFKFVIFIYIFFVVSSENFLFQQFIIYLKIENKRKTEKSLFKSSHLRQIESKN